MRHASSCSTLGNYRHPDCSFARAKTRGQAMRRLNGRTACCAHRRPPCCRRPCRPCRCCRPCRRLASYASFISRHRLVRGSSRRTASASVHACQRRGDESGATVGQGWGARHAPRHLEWSYGQSSRGRRPQHTVPQARRRPLHVCASDCSAQHSAAQRRATPRAAPLPASQTRPCSRPAAARRPPGGAGAAAPAPAAAPPWPRAGC